MWPLWKVISWDSWLGEDVNRAIFCKILIFELKFLDQWNYLREWTCQQYEANFTKKRCSKSKCQEARANYLPLKVNGLSTWQALSVYFALFVTGDLLGLPSNANWIVKQNTNECKFSMRSANRVIFFLCIFNQLLICAIGSSILFVRLAGMILILKTNYSRM